jgi:hypothetical protein
MNKLLNKLFLYKAMVGKGFPRFNMSSSPKVRRYMPTTSASKKKPSPKCSGAKNEKRNMVEGPPAMWTNLMVVS